MKTQKTVKAVLSFVLSVIMVFSVMAPSAFAITVDSAKLGEDTYLTSKTDYTVAPGITESQITTNNGSGSNQVKGYALEVDLNNPTTSIIASYKDYDTSSWGMQKVRDQAYAAEAKLGVNVVAGVNGDFFNMSNGAPTGTLVMNGVVANTNNKWNYFAILKDGTPVIGSGTLDTSTVKECIGGPAVLVKDGALTSAAKTSSYGVDQLPRTAIGIKADGSVVLFVADGRQAPSSCGQTFLQLANLMLSLGCVDVLSLDGGGSSTFISQHEGSEELVCRNSPSDGTERTVSTALLVCSSATSTGEFDHATILPNNEVYTPGSSVTFTASGVDSAASAAPLPEDGELVLADDSFGTMENGVFTSTGKTGTVVVQYVTNGKVAGSTSIEIQTPDSISFTNEEISLGFEAETDLGLTVKYQNRDIHYNEGDILWSLDDEKMGSFRGNTFISSDSESITGKIYAASAYDSKVSGSITAVIGKLPAIIWDFENPEDYIFAHAVCEASGGTVTSYDSDYVPNVTTMLNINYGRNSVVNSEIVDADTGEVRMGSHALKISFDFTKVGKVTEGACIGGVKATESTEGTPTAVGLWLYAPEGTPNYWVRMRFRDGNGTVQTVNFTESSGIDWVGWKYLEADLTSFKAPFSFIAGETIRMMAVANSSGYYTYAGVDENGESIFNSVAKANRKGYVYIDNVQFVYGANTDDVDNPVIDSLQIGSAAGDNMANIGVSTVVSTNDISLETSFHDVQNKYKTGINFDACRLYVDGKDVTDDSIVLPGDSMMKYYATLANGVHSVKVVIRDGFNNVTTDTRYFPVDGSENLPTVKVEPVSESCVLNSEYTLGVLANKASAVDGVTASIRLDTDIVTSADAVSVAFEDGFTGSFDYSAETGILTLSIEKDGNLETADTGEFVSIASITVQIPSDVTQGKSFLYRVLEGSIRFSDDTIVTDTFSSADISSPVEESFTVSADTVLVGVPAVFTVVKADGSAAADVDVYNHATGEKIGTTDENGVLTYDGFSDSVGSFSIYAMKDGAYSFAYSAQSVASAGDASGAPEYVMINASVNGDTEKNITWLSHPLASAGQSVVRYAAKADYEAKGEAAFVSVTGTNTIYAFLGSTDITKNYASRINAVTVRGLKENTEYVYVAGDGEHWSALKSFKTGISNADTSFFVFGDIQAEDTTNIANMLTAVANDGVSYSFGLQTGDSVEVATEYPYWQDILSVFSDDHIAASNMIHVLGNHEYMGDPSGEAAESIYNLPDESFYSVEYGNVYVAVINYRGNTSEEKAEAIEWLRTDAAKSDAMWKIVTLHTPVYNSNILDSQDYLRENLVPVLQEVGIDFVFSGHDHSYSRTLPMTDGAVDEENGIVYFICGSSGEKSYGVTNTPEFHFEIATNEYTAVYLSVTATDSKMTVTAYDVSGSEKVILDSYTRTKTTECTANGHVYAYEDGYLKCSVCGYTILPSEAAYTGAATDAATGKAMYFRDGAPLTGWNLLDNGYRYFDSNGLEETDHDYRYFLGHFICNDCGYVIETTGYTGLTADLKTNLPMYLINGTPVTGWFVLGDDNYCFDDDGVAQTGEITIDGHTYTFGEDGKMIKGSLEKQSSGRYCYYINGELQRGWHFIDGYWYYFNRVSTNFMSVNTKNATIEGLTYSFDSESRLIAGAWNTTEQGTAYYWGPNYVTGLQEIDGDTYYFKPSDSYKLVNDSVDIDGTVYAFDAEGKLAHYGEHVDADGDGACDLCSSAKSPIWNLLEKLIALIEKIKIFLTKIFG